MNDKQNADTTRQLLNQLGSYVRPRTEEELDREADARRRAPKSGEPYPQAAVDPGGYFNGKPVFGPSPLTSMWSSEKWGGKVGQKMGTGSVVGSYVVDDFDEVIQGLFENGMISMCDCPDCREKRRQEKVEQIGEADELGSKCAAAVLLADRSRIVAVTREQWIGFNLLERDDELPKRSGGGCAGDSGVAEGPVRGKARKAP